jgi:hypothetical protein
MNPQPQSKGKIMKATLMVRAEVDPSKKQLFDRWYKVAEGLGIYLFEFATGQPVESRIG